jgi:hypothetical protein
MKPRRISFTKKFIKNPIPCEKSETTDLLLRSTHLWCWRWKLPEAPSTDGAATLQEQQLRRQRDRQSCFSSFFGRQTLTLIPKALLVTGPQGLFPGITGFHTGGGFPGCHTIRVSRGP